MKYTFDKQWGIKLLFFLFVVLSAGVVEVLNRNQLQVLEDHLQREAKDQLSAIRSKLEATIVSDIYIVSSLATLVSLHPSSNVQALNEASSKIIRKGRHLKNVVLAKDDVVNYVYPLSGNEQVLGLDYHTVPKQWASILKAKNIAEIFIAGPVNLVQGGRGLIARVPIFSDPPLNTQYWGVCSAVLNLDSLFTDVGLVSFAYKYKLAIKGYDSQGADGDIFWGEQETYDLAFVREKVNFPYGGWVLAVAKNEQFLAGVPWYQLNIVRLLGYPILLLLGLVFITIYRLYDIARIRSLHDELTGLPNRRYFMYSLDRYFRHAQKLGKDETFAVINFDLDRFKHINDTFGHAAGDKVLLACAERVKSTLRSTDIIARIGGDEFLIILPRVQKQEDIAQLIEKLKSALCANPVVYESELIYLHVSIGYAFFHHDLRNFDDMLKEADDRMYLEKKLQREAASSLVS
ncbi:sensor domain-containing diguanylate cyclase [Vibrio navarrensis]|uniref:Sensor domain-containing diguanylate cyclase n=1 Tax=Vibrio navarrensis TaxID=29495 RepID=A0AAJ4IGB7_9VIBR|nr:MULTISPECIES: diguanylate cyclase [Vibrio]KJR39876.1 diguanylate cyclase [Vibrio sp. S234-5]MBE3651465.1 sensor domain-containing diguanylate cyclase [Vibrio navarrensis]MBE3656889.1 sensor domain-containing diguanylate cyclase [Vibrio navarrensis]MBE3660281.1 sensor domain-containing diguanylate cyclase [Vibrio navarrensis]MBE4602868.1 sensor domain-containing diguanylate cyclase [Vibrio navarrensis]